MRIFLFCTVAFGQSDYNDFEYNANEFDADLEIENLLATYGIEEYSAYSFADYSYGDDDAEIFAVTTTTTSTTTTTTTTEPPRAGNIFPPPPALRGMPGVANDGTGPYRYCLKCVGETLAECVAKQAAATGSEATGFSGYENCDEGGSGDIVHSSQVCYTTIRTQGSASTARFWSGCSTFQSCNSQMNQNFRPGQPQFSQCRPTNVPRRFQRPSTCTFCYKLSKKNNADNGIDATNEIWDESSSTGELNYGAGPTVFDLMTETGFGVVQQTGISDDDSLDAVGIVYQAHGAYV